MIKSVVLGVLAVLVFCVGDIHGNNPSLSITWSDKPQTSAYETRIADYPLSTDRHGRIIHSNQDIVSPFVSTDTVLYRQIWSDDSVLLEQVSLGKTISPIKSHINPEGGITLGFWEESDGNRYFVFTRIACDGVTTYRKEYFAVKGYSVTNGWVFAQTSEYWFVLDTTLSLIASHDRTEESRAGIDPNGNIFEIYIDRETQTDTTTVLSVRKISQTNTLVKDTSITLSGRIGSLSAPYYQSGFWFFTTQENLGHNGRSVSVQRKRFSFNVATGLSNLGPTVGDHYYPFSDSLHIRTRTWTTNVRSPSPSTKHQAHIVNVCGDVVDSLKSLSNQNITDVTPTESGVFVKMSNGEYASIDRFFSVTRPKLPEMTYQPSQDMIISTAQPLSGGGFIAAGYTTTRGYGYRLWIMNIDSTGTVVSQRLFRETLPVRVTASASTCEGIFLTGSYDNNEVWAGFVTVDGDLAWSRQYSLEGSGDHILPHQTKALIVSSDTSETNLILIDKDGEIIESITLSGNNPSVPQVTPSGWVLTTYENSSAFPKVRLYHINHSLTIIREKAFERGPGVSVYPYTDGFKFVSEIKGTSGGVLKTEKVAVYTLDSLFENRTIYNTFEIDGEVRSWLPYNDGALAVIRYSQYFHRFGWQRIDNLYYIKESGEMILIDQVCNRNSSPSQKELMLIPVTETSFLYIGRDLYVFPDISPGYAYYSGWRSELVLFHLEEKTNLRSDQFVLSKRLVPAVSLSGRTLHIRNAREIAVYTLSGRCIHRSFLDPGTDGQNISLDHLSTGSYIIRLKGVKRTKTSRITLY
ncbi:hypothetical protein CHISP_0676 [Chitinispirillum alkaliphilum]|nr:hypothetical protein CHISP_0676 [Chitinispirillum alkaliphilum]